MKLIFAIVHDDDAHKVIEALNAESYSVTKLCSTGGFLKAGNTTMLVGIEDDGLEKVLVIIKANSKSRKQSIPGTFMRGMAGVGSIEVTVGGATVFVTDVERMEKF